MAEHRFFLAHAKNEPNLDAMISTARAALEHAAPGKPYSITTGLSFFEARFKAAGSWEAWIAEVASGVNFVTREPLFHCILVPAGPIGAGTARIVEKSITAGKPVFSFRGLEISHVVGVLCEDRTNWQTGFRLLEG